ncbi:PREDICTED: uncharacterized protein LOC109592195 [Amphimedon queenslandica]|uniref:Uncharacterized protein n=1 Tax=Amphimedon queenslandica TaxID=400682 RepID=A0AAN0K1Q0_AMPQE|nr:PREDICTED: uncharacterized protein LOC109592195 [Amphimedon queenslandica]|eukprot:XP_019863275.1 PREDICTED: uncharacterized protein LOC109592195 [Amphimedon queenslandica]
MDNLECLSDVNIASKKLFLIQGDRPQLLNWERYGLRIGVSGGSLSSTETGEVAVVALVGGQFVFPKNTVLVSAVYAVSISRPLLKATNAVSTVPDLGFKESGLFYRIQEESFIRIDPGSRIQRFSLILPDQE